MPGSLKSTSSRLFRGAKKKRRTDKTVNVFTPPVTQEEKIKLAKEAKRLVIPGKGIITVDEPLEELAALFKKRGLENTAANRLAFVLEATGDSKVLRPYVTGVTVREDICLLRINKHETIVNKLTTNDIRLGIRIDKAPVPLAGTNKEVTSSGLDTLMADCTRYYDLGASFALMTSVFKISDYTPSYLAYIENANTLARFASTCHKAGLVPVLSIQVDNTSTVTRNSSGQAKFMATVNVMEEIISFVVKALADYNVYLEGILLRLSPVASHANITTSEIQRMAVATLSVISHRIPPAIGGVLIADVNNLKNSNFLLHEIHVALSLKPCPITFGWDHVVIQGLADKWNSQEKTLGNNVPSNNSILEKLMEERLKNCSLASMGQLPNDQRSFFITNASET